MLVLHSSCKGREGSNRHIRSNALSYTGNLEIDSVVAHVKCKNHRTPNFAISEMNWSLPQISDDMFLIKA